MAIRSSKRYATTEVRTKGEYGLPHQCAHWFAMTSKDRRHYRDLGTAARRGKGISDSAAADLIASHAPLRNGSHKARQNGPKHYPGDPTGAAAPLVCLSSISFFKQRKIWPPEGVGIVERLVKNVQSKTPPPEVAGQSARRGISGQYK